MKSNPRVQLAVRNAVCEDCRLCEQAQGKDRCVTAQGNHEADVLVVTKNPLGTKSEKELITYLSRAGFNSEKLAFTGATKCLTWDMTPTKSDIKACKQYIDQEIDFIKPKWVLCLGNEALQVVTGRSGILKYRGQINNHTTKTSPRVFKVMGTISPAMVYRNPGQKHEFEADLKFFYNQVYSTTTTKNRVKPTKSQYQIIDTREKLKNFIKKLKQADVAAIDLETSGFDEFAPDARIITMSVTICVFHDKALQSPSDADIRSYVIPLWHPESVWAKQWRKVFSLLSPHLNRLTKVVAHNGKFDCRWMRQFGCKVKLTFDTMLAAHLLDENRPKGLKSLARTLLGAPAWDIKIANVKGKPWWESHSLKQICLYNALDTWYTLKLYFVLKEQLKKQPRLAKLFTRMIMPASESFTEIERKGIWVDREQLETNYRIAEAELISIDERLFQWVPESHRKERVNFRPSNFLRWWLFAHLELPILKRGKSKEDGTPGAPSVAEAVMLELRDKHPVIPLLLERAKWEKYCSAFFSAYTEQLDKDSRIHTTFKIAGTVTGRLSSGKADGDKVTGVKQIRGMNAQQVPRDKFVRGIFGAAPGFWFVEADYSQVELRIAAFLAQEPTMLHLYATGQDIHMATAMRMTGKPASQVLPEERKKAKAVNFGFLYGMGWYKFIQTAWANYQLRVSDSEAQEFRKAFFGQFPLLLPWHSKQRRLAHKYGRVSSPIGRIRHLPDITSANQEVRAEAERQAINSPVQSFASDMNLLAMISLDRQFKEKGMKSIPIGTVHDATNFEIPEEELPQVLPMIKDTMENLPLQELFGVELNIPIIADLKLGKRWGGAKELTEDQIYNFSLNKVV